MWIVFFLLFQSTVYVRLTDLLNKNGSQKDTCVALSLLHFIFNCILCKLLHIIEKKNKKGCIKVYPLSCHWPSFWTKCGQSGPPGPHSVVDTMLIPWKRLSCTETSATYRGCQWTLTAHDMLQTLCISGMQGTRHWCIYYFFYSGSILHSIWFKNHKIKDKIIKTLKEACQLQTCGSCWIWSLASCSSHMLMKSSLSHMYSLAYN